MVIAHNLVAMNAQRQYGIVTSSKAKNTEKLSSGYKINRAADDAAGLTISEKMRSQIRGLNQGSANIQDGVSLVQIADGALAEVNDMLHRMTELSIKSANGTNTSEDRAAIQKEIHQIIQEIDRIHESTEFNTMKLFDGETAKLDGPVADIGPVKCASTAKGYMVENYNGHPAAIVDFGGINSTNIGDLKDKYFAFQCTQGCGEMFKFTFIDDGTGSRLKNDSTSLHDFVIDISTLSTGADIVSEIYDTVENSYLIAKDNYENGTSNPGGLKYAGGFTNIESSLTDGVPVGHANGMDKKSATELAIYGYSSNPDQFKNSTSGTMGKVDTKSMIIPPKEVGKMKPFWIQASGSSPDDGMTIEVEKMDAKYLRIDDVNVSTQDGAKDSIDKIKNASSHVSAMRSSLGAYQNRLEHSYANNMNKAENTTVAESRIRDTDMAEMMMKFTKDNILAQATEAMMAQANQSTQGVLSLLQ